MRRGSVNHRFRYAAAFALVDLDEAEGLLRSSWLASSGRFTPASLRMADHPIDGRTATSAQDLADLVRKNVGRVAGATPTGPVRLLCQFRQFGVYFSPLNLYYCYSADGGRVEAVVAEVSNTPWNERQLYVLHAGNRVEKRPSVNSCGVLRFAHAKDFHVSPFMPLERRYEWRLTEPSDRLSVRIRSRGERVEPFDAVMTLQRQPWNEHELARILLRFPVAGAQVLAAIYWQAFQLWRKRCTFYPHPGSETGREPAKSIPRFTQTSET